LFLFYFLFFIFFIFFIFIFLYYLFFSFYFFLIFFVLFLFYFLKPKKKKKRKEKSRMDMFFSRYVPTPSLVENGTKYFLNATLKQCHEIKENYYNGFFNLCCFLGLLMALTLFLVVKYKGKPTPMEKQQKEREKQQYIISKIQTFKEARQRMHQSLITGLPMWENDYSNVSWGSG
jgi:Ca2+/Na+ antiporter